MPKASTLWKISTATSPESEEAIAAVIEAVCGVAPSIYIDAQTNESVAEAYLRNTPSLALLAELKLRINAIRGMGLPVPRIGLRLQRLKRRDWAESWKAHFKPIEIGQRLLIRPSWSKREARRGQAVIVLDPGLGFGTGQHATTRFCLEQIVANQGDGHRSFLDMGTGSGILALAAAKLGYAPVHAIDSDPDAVRIALANARRNRVQENLKIECRDLARDLARLGGPKQGYDLVCANLTADLLLKERLRIIRQVGRGGRLVLAGILVRQFAEVARAYEGGGLKRLTTKSEGGWKSGVFAFCREINNLLPNRPP